RSRRMRARRGRSRHRGPEPAAPEQPGVNAAGGSTVLGAVCRVARGARGYPAALLDLAEQAPEVLYGRGDRGAVADVDPHQTVTIVGSRRATSYGLELAERIAR